MGNPNADKRRPNRDRVVSVRFGETEYERLSRVADRAGQNVSVFVRASTFERVDAARSSRERSEPSGTKSGAGGAARGVDTVDLEVLREWISEHRALRSVLNRIGTNVNQLTRLSNQNRGVVLSSSDDIGNVTALLRDAKAVLDEASAVLLNGRAL